MDSYAILFVKNPVPGQVKTRLQPACSPAQAAELYSAFARDAAEILAACKAACKVVAFAPADAGEALARLLPSGPFEWVPQPEGDLGQRMHGMMRYSFARGSRRSVILGSDSPSLPVEYVDQALDLLEDRELVLGPSTDGGYYLIGQRHPDSAPFRGIDWSTGQVLEQALKKSAGRSLGLLPPWYDVDTGAEAAFLRVHLEALAQAGQQRARHSLEVLRGLELPAPS